jgi:hypothetical protein
LRDLRTRDSVGDGDGDGEVDIARYVM